MDDFDARVALLRRAYEAFNARRIDDVLALLDPEVEWPNVAEGTVLHGHDAVREYWQRQLARIDSRVEPTAFVADGERVIVAVHQVVRDLAGKVQSDSQVAHAYAFRGDRVLRMTVHAIVGEAGG